MGRMLALAIVMFFGSLAAAEAQPANGSKSFGGMGSSTPGGDTRPAAGTYATPGAEQRSTVPGGGIPMGVGSQNSSELPDNPDNSDRVGRGSKSR